MEEKPLRGVTRMTIAQIAKILDAKWICGEEQQDLEITYAFASDMMSDVLAHVGMDTMLLTGLINSQSVRTAEMLDVPCLVFVRGKIPHKDAVQRAQQIDLPLLMTSYSMFEACGRLYEAGMSATKLEQYDGDGDDD